MAAVVSADTLDEVCARQGTADCLYCGGSDYRVLHSGIRDRLGYVPGEWSYLRCRQCGSSTVSPTPAAHEIAGLYPPVYTFAPELAQQGTLKRWLALVEQRLFYDSVYRSQTGIVARHTKSAASTSGDRPRLLDIGCGRGLRLAHFQRRGYDVCGMDFAPDSVEYVNDQLGIPAVCTDVAGLTSVYQPGSFDVITAFYVLEHVADVGETLRQCWSLLRPGGWIAGAVPIADSTQAAILGRRWANYTEAPRHIAVPTQAAMVKLCAAAGFDPDATFIRPDSVMSCAGTAALSLLPGSAVTKVYGGGGLRAMLSRLAGPLALLGCLPWALVDNYCFGRSGKAGLAIVFAQKPADAGLAV